MKFQTENTQLVKRGDKVFLYTEIPLAQADELNKLVTKDVEKMVEIKVKREARSHTANSYFWVLLVQLAKKIIMPKGDMYIKMIKRYGTFIQVSVRDEALSTLITSWDRKNTDVEHTESLSDITNSFRSKGQLWHELNCHEGSSGYSKEEFSKLLQGLIFDCEEIGLSTMTPKEIEGLMANYKGD